MQPNELPRQDNVVTLNDGKVSSISLGKLPLASYSYSFYIVNPAGVSGKLSVVAKGRSWEAPELQIAFDDALSEHQYNFKTPSPYDYCHIEFVTSSNEPVWLHYPVSPVMVQDTVGKPSYLFEVGEKLQSRILEMEPGRVAVAAGSNGKASSYSRQGMAPADMGKIESLIDARYFRGFLSLEEAERQLDYVIFHKLFAPDGSRGFSGFKRKVYRKMLRGIYRLLTRNRSRKRYFAKLYGNYVNMGSLAENLQK